MSMINGLLRALGFGGGNDDEDDLELDMRAEASALPEAAGHHQRPEREISSAKPDDNPEPDDAKMTAESNTTTDPVDAKAVFNGVVEVLNNNLPPYLRQCLDSEQQCRFIYERLDESLRAYIAGVAEAEAEAEKANRRWASEKKKLFRQVNEATEQIAQATERASKAEEKALSADRQKRAMTQRNADLERRVARLQAEIEQYDLEKNSLLNKLRVAEVNVGSHATAPAIAANTADKEAAERTARELDEAKAEIAALKARLDEAGKALDVVNEIQAQMKNIEEMKNRKNQRIKELKEENARLRADIETLQAAGAANLEADIAADTAESTYEPATEPTPAAAFADDVMIDMTAPEVIIAEPDASGVTAVIADDMDMLAAITENDAMIEAPAATAKKKRKPRTRKPKLVAIDETISESEWLMSSSPVPPEATGFGYQEPPRRTTPPDNPAQMSLW